MNGEIYRKILNSMEHPLVVLKEKSVLEANEKALELFSEASIHTLNKSHRLKAILEQLTYGNTLSVYHTFFVELNKRLKYKITLNNLPHSNIQYLSFEDIHSDYIFEELHLLEEHNSKFFNNAPDGICLVSNNNEILKINAAFSKIFGYKSYEVIGQDIDELLVPEDRLEASKNLFQKLDKDQKIETEDIRMNKNGIRLNVKIISYPIKIHGTLHGHYILYKNITKEKQSKAVIQFKDEFLDQLFNRSIFPIAILDNNEIILDINKKFEEVFEYKPKEIIGKCINDFLVPENKIQEIDFFRRTINNNEALKTKTQRLSKSGELIDVEAVGSPVNIKGEVIGMFAMYKDIREETKILKDLEKQHAYFKQLFDKSPDAIVLLNQINEIVDANPKFIDFFEYNKDELIGKNIDDFIIPKNDELNANQLSNNVIHERVTVNTESVRCSKSGDLKHVEILAYPIILNNNNFGAYAVYRDISDRKSKEKHIHQLVYTDNLTKTFNRRKFYQVVDKEIERYKRYETPFSIMIIDIDNFKEINDLYGHLSGDKILIQVADVIKSHIRENDYLFRWGGDEFIILFANADYEIDLSISKKIENLIENTSFTDSIPVSISTGIASYKNSLDTLIMTADQRMYHNKENKKRKLG